MTPKIIWDSIYDFIRSWILIRPQNFIRLCKNKDLYAGLSYFPDKRHNSKILNFLNQTKQIIKFQEPEEYFYLYGYDYKNRKEISTYVNYAEFVKIRTQLNHKSIFNDSTCILYNKLYFGAFAKAFGISVADNVAYLDHGKLFILLPQMHEVPFENITDISEGYYFVKSLSGENGDDIFQIKISDNKVYKNDVILSLDDFKEIIDKGKYIIQTKIKQHPIMDQLYPGSINTLRIFTVRSLKDNKLYTLPSVVRMGSGGAFIDNGSKGGLMVGVDLQTGELYDYALRKPEYGRVAYEHPDTNVKFKGFKIPYIQECVDACMHFHELFPDIHSIGWDVVVTENGPLFIEGNDNWEIEVPQMYRGIRKEFDEYFTK